MIYLDNAATTLNKPPEVARAVLEALGSAGNASRGAHGSSLGASRTVYRTRVKLAKLFGCPRPDHVMFASNVTEALNTAIFGLIGEGAHVVSTVAEHNSVLRPLFALADRRGVKLDLAPVDEKGRVSPDAVRALLRSDTKAVVCGHASNLTGNVNDIAAIAEMAHAAGAVVILDAAQTAGVLPLDMTAAGIDVVCFTGHKGLMGPQGTGGLCVREGLDIAPLKVGGTGVKSFSLTQPEEYPTRLEAGTLNTHGIAGLGAALDFIETVGVRNIHARERELETRFLEGIRGIPNLRLYGDLEAETRCAIVSLNIGDIPSGEISDALASGYDIATRAGAHCAPLLHRALHTQEQGAVRFSFGYFNTEDEVDAAARALCELAVTFT